MRRRGEQPKRLPRAQPDRVLARRSDRISVAPYMKRDSPLAHFYVSFNSDRLKA